MLFGMGIFALLTVSLLGFFVGRVILATLTNSPLNPASNLPIRLPDSALSTLSPDLIAQMTQEAISGELPTPMALPTLNTTERLTILLMGQDRRSGENYYSRTDTIILFSFDPQTKQASMLSIPRDLYVEIPNYGRDRINTAFVLGAYESGEAGGAQLAMDTVEYNLGVEVDHYLIIDFDAVINIIDQFGGVTINVPSEINDPLYPDMNYGYDPLYIPAGIQTMSGELALKYMRTRHGDTDFGRSRRQQQLILAFREQLMANGVRGVISRAPAVFGHVKEGVLTDMALNDMLSLINASSDIAENNIKTGVLDTEYVTYHTTASGASVLLLRPDLSSQLIQELFQ